MKAKRLQLVGVVLLSCLVLASCAGKKQMQAAPQDPAKLYTDAMVLFNNGQYKEAIVIFTRLKDYFPSDELYAPKADIRIADCHRLRKEYPEAITRYQEFKKQHPFHPDLPYVEYQLGLCYYRQILSKDRDQKATEQALSIFQNVVANYPGTVFAGKAPEKIAFCRCRLAEHELYVAHFYLRKDEYAAAEKRAYTALEKYPASGVDDKALYYLALALHKQEKDAAAFTPLQLLVEDHPQSPYAKPGERLLASLKDEGVVAGTPMGGEVVARAGGLWEEGETSPFRITARKQEDLTGMNAILYTGDAVALGDQVTIRAESILLTKDEAGAPTELVARDEVLVKQGENEIFCNKAVWSPTENIIVMTEDAKIRGIGEWTRGDKITLDLDTGRMEVTGERVETRMEPIGGNQ